MNGVAWILIAFVAISPVAIGGTLCSMVVDNVHMQEVAHRATAARRARWAHL